LGAAHRSYLQRLIEYALIGGTLGPRHVTEITEIELQRFLNEHVAAGASRSKLSKLLLYLRNIFDYAVMKKLIPANPARNQGYRLKAKSRKSVSGRYLSMKSVSAYFQWCPARIALHSAFSSNSVFAPKNFSRSAAMM
jgi:site-specific recombinase XerD